jgi:hypothetical protein
VWWRMMLELEKKELELARIKRTMSNDVRYNIISILHSYIIIIIIIMSHTLDD